MNLLTEVPNERSLRPPWFAYKTFKNFLNGLKDTGIPDRIDRSIMSATMSGSNQVQTLAALKFLNLIDENNSPKDTLHTLVESEESDRAALLRQVLTPAYNFLISNLDIERATTKQVEEEFRKIGVTGDSIRKSLLFFLFAAKDAEMKVSSHIKTNKGARNSVQRTRKAPLENGGQSNQNKIEEKRQDVPPPQSVTPQKPPTDFARHYGHVTKILLSENREAEFSIPDRLTRRDAQKLKGALNGLGAIIDSMIDDEQDSEASFTTNNLQ